MADWYEEMEYGYREVIPNQTVAPRRRDITVNIGAAQGTLQDIKRPEACGGYSYRESDQIATLTRNRFFYWRIYHDTLELSEESLDIDLTGNHICLRFQDTPVLDGVTLHEDGKNVVLLVATVSSVHRIVLTHPNKQNQESGTWSFRPMSVPSVLTEITAAQVREPSNSYVLNWSGAPGTLPHSSSCWLSLDGEAHFALACSVGSILLVHLPRTDAAQGAVIVRELRHSSVMQRVWTGIVPSIMRGGGMANDAPVGLCFHAVDKMLVLFVLCRDSKIRMWSTKEQDCIMVCDLMRYVSDVSSLQKVQPMGQRHMLKKAIGTHRNELFLGVFLHFMDRSQFLVLQLVTKSGNYDLEYVSSFYSPEFDLTDFGLTSHMLWALWTNMESEPVLRYAMIDSAVAPTSGWNNVYLEPPVGREFHFPEGLMDPREAYCQYIFYPGRFSLQTITKAINIYRRSADLSCLSEVNTSSTSTLYEEVISTVEMEIQNRASEYELSDEQYIQLQQDCWSKFYLSCIQYHQVGTKPMGLCGGANSGLLCLIKKNTFSLLRPCEALEQLALGSSDERFVNEFFPDLALQDAALTQDLVALFRCLHLVRSRLSVEIIHDFRYDLFHLIAPDIISQYVVDKLLLASGDKENDMPLLNQLTDVVQSISNLLTTIQTLLGTIDLAHGAPQDLVIDSNLTDVGRRLVTNKLFGSKLGSSVLAEAVHQMAQCRYDMGRDLLIFLELIMRSGIQISIVGQLRETIRSNLVPKTCVLIQAYFLLTWFCETVASSASIDILDAGIRQLAILNLSETSYGESKSMQPDTHSLRLVELFIQGDGGALSRILLAEGNAQETCHLGRKAFLHFVTIIAQLVWPITVNFVFPEFLMAQCQYMQLQEYVRLLQPWCEWNSCSRKFLCGHTHLIQGDPDKALDWFLAAVNDISQEEFIVTKVLMAEDVDPSQLNMLYFLKVIRLFEQCLHAEHVVTLARAAIDNAERNSSHLPTLGTILFKYLLELGHNNDAYAAMMAIPDHSRKKDCLRQFIVVLFERHELKALVEYPYPDMLDEVVDIIESRARTIDLTVHSYYELLYSFHVFRGNFRRAGSVMYEYGMRLGNEVSGLKGLQKQAKCYLAAMNCLHLVDPQYAWIVKPVPTENILEAEQPGMSPKRSSDGDEKVPTKIQPQVILVELGHIRKEYELVLARLRLIKMNPDPIIAKGPTYAADETVMLLCNVGLFDVAIRTCKTFKLSLETVFEALTSRCVHLMRSVGSVPNAAHEAWEWLMENETPGLQFSKETSVVDHVWRLLKFYLDTYEEKGQIIYHRCVINRLLSNACPLPHWLLASYKEYDMADLLRQYLKFEMLEQATGLVLEYIDAILGNGKEYFGLKSQLEVNAPPVWLPYSAIDNLMEMMEEAIDKDPSMAFLRDALINKLENYHFHVENISKTMLKNARQRLVVA